MDLQARYRLRNGVEIPLFGLGTWRAKSGEARRAVCAALQAGYRLVDTAAYYGNEEEVAGGLRDSGLPRGEVFLTSKVWAEDSGYEETLCAFEKTMARLGLDYLDMYMVHWPVVGKYKETYRALEELYQQGRIKAIGVSNFSARLMKEMDEEMEIGPMVNQVEFHPQYFRREAYEYCKANGILLQAWKPLGREGILQDDGLCQMAQRHGKSPQQVLLRWGLQLGNGMIPKTVNPQRLRENADVFDFALSDAEMAHLTGLDTGKSLSSLPDGVVVD